MTVEQRLEALEAENKQLKATVEKNKQFEDDAFIWCTRKGQAIKGYHSLVDSTYKGQPRKGLVNVLAEAVAEGKTMLSVRTFATKKDGVDCIGVALQAWNPQAN